MKTKNNNLTKIAILIALSVVLSYLKIPSPTGSVALDALPGYFAAVAISPLSGGIVGAIGHFFTALNSGFPLGVPIHAVVAFTMFVACFGFGLVYKKNKALGIITGVVLNTFVSLGIISFMIPWEVIVALFLPLLVGSIINVILASMVYETIKNRL